MLSMTDIPDTARLMDAVYRNQRHFYDLTRKYYLLGRDRLIRELAPPDNGTVLELGCGTGRNLIAAARRYPGVRFYGLDISEQMLETARAQVARAGLAGRITLVQGDASDPAAVAQLGVAAFDRVFFSYTLSMMPVWREALAVGLFCLKPGGRIHVVDFGQQDRLPAWFKRVLMRWLAAFHVTPRPDLKDEIERLAERSGASASFVPIYRGYAVMADLTKP